MQGIPISISAAISIGILTGIYIERRWDRSRTSPPSAVNHDDDEDTDDDDDDEEEIDEDDELRIILAVRQDLKMGKGKICAQCSHAALGAYKQARRKSPDLVRRYERSGETKIAVKIQDLQQMQELRHAAESMSIPTHLVIDAGRTQIPAHSATVLALGPAPKRLLAKICSHLKLL